VSYPIHVVVVVAGISGSTVSGGRRRGCVYISIGKGSIGMGKKG